MRSAHIRFSESQHRFSPAITILVLTNHRPVVDPFHGLKVHDTTVCFLILEMQKPVFPTLCGYPGALVRSIDGSTTLFHYIAPFVRPINISGTKYRLPTCRYTTRRSEYIIPAITFVQFWPFNSRVFFMTVIHNDTFIKCTRTVRIHP